MGMENVQIFQDPVIRQRAYELVKSSANDAATLKPGTPEAGQFMSSLGQLFVADGPHDQATSNAFRLGLIGEQQAFWKDLPIEMQMSNLSNTGQEAVPGSSEYRQLQADTAKAEHILGQLNAEATRLGKNVPEASVVELNPTQQTRKLVIDGRLSEISEQMDSLTSQIGTLNPGSSEIRSALAELSQLQAIKQALVSEQMQLDGANPFAIRSRLQEMSDQHKVTLVDAQLNYWSTIMGRLDGDLSASGAQPGSAKWHQYTAEVARVNHVRHQLELERTRLTN